VADGMGGHRSGEVASAMAIKAIVEYYRETIPDSSEPAPDRVADDVAISRDEKRLVESIKMANTAVFRAAGESEIYRGMGTTIVSALFREDCAYLAHIGDSRAYRLRAGEVVQQTDDHSLANEYVRMGILAKEDVEHFPYKNVITRACGLTDDVEVEVTRADVQPGDVFILCSDGLTDMVSDPDILTIANENDDLNVLCQELVRLANENGGADNITVIIARVEE
jgi:protein phosphatase